MEGEGPAKSIFPWYISALLALLFMTLGMYLCSHTADLPWATDTLAALGFLLFGVSLSLMCWASEDDRAKPGYLAYMRYTYLTPKDEGSSTAPGTVPALLCGLFQFLAQCALIFGFHYFPSGAGFSTTFLCGASLLSAVFAYFAYEEKLSYSQIIGMLASACSLVYLSMLGGNTLSTEVLVVEGISVLFYALRSLMAREAELQGMHSSDFSALLSISDGTLGLLMWLAMVILGIDIWSGGGQLYWALIGGFAMAIGVYFLVQAIMAGFVGPSLSIANLNSVLMVIIQHQAQAVELDTFKVYAMVAAVSGVVFMIFGDDLLWLFGFNCLIARDALEVEEPVHEVPMEMRDELMHAQDRID